MEILLYYQCMHTFLIAAISLDGFIAEKTDQISTSWTSKEDKKFFSERTKQAGVIVMGSSTYKTIGRPLPGRVNVVYSKSSQFEFKDENEGFVTDLAPADLLKKLERDGHDEVAICGGAMIYSMFMKAGLIDTLYLTIEPVLFGEGIKLFKDDISARLQLVNSSKMGENAVLLEYKLNK
nr:Dihydrofolate reductase [uncultured bacterium]